MNTVPRSITPPLLNFCAEISDQRPKYVRSKPSSDAQPSACFDNVTRKIERANGKAVHGWAIWHIPELYFEAEHHGVWSNREGKLLDVSPQINGVGEILFLPDPKATYEETSFRQNIVRPANFSANSIEFSNLSNEYHTIFNKYRTGRASAQLLNWPLPDHPRKHRLADEAHFRQDNIVPLPELTTRFSKMISRQKSCAK